MKRLFGVKNKATGRVMPMLPFHDKVYTDSKMKAKAFRDNLNTAAEKSGSKNHYTVCLGPDHRRYHASH